MATRAPQVQAPDWSSARRQVGGGLLSVIMPAYALGSTIADNIRKVHALLSGHVPFEIIAVDDGSADNTASELTRVAAELPGVVPVHLQTNVGKGGALREGFARSRGSHVLFLDADLDLPPSLAARFFEVMDRERADVVIGSKRHRDSIIDYPWYRRLASAAYYLVVKLLVALPVRDTQTGIKLFRRPALDYIVPRMLVRRFAFDLELLAIAREGGFRISEAPIRLEFHGKWGCFRPATVHNILVDTLSVFYRVRVLGYYRNIRETRMPAEPPLVSVLVTMPAPSPVLDKCLRGLADQTYPNREVILLPDAPTGRRWPGGVRELPTGRVRPAEKRNAGLREARGSIAAFLDDDAVPSPDWLARAVPYFGAAEVAAVGGPATTPPDESTMARLSGDVLANPLVTGAYRYRYTPTRVQDVDDFPSCNLLVRKDDMDRVNGFRPEFWPGEDTFLCMELTRRLGKKIVYDPRVHVVHYRRRLFGPHLRQIGRYALHRGYFARRYPATSRKFAYMIPSLFVLGLSGGAVLAAFSVWLRVLYVSLVEVYLIVTLLSCFRGALFLSTGRVPLREWMLTWFGIVLTHIVYGSRFLQGLLSRRMPGEAARFDHASEGGA